MPHVWHRRTHSLGFNAGDWFDALMIVLAMLVLVGEVLVITVPFH